MPFPSSTLFPSSGLFPGNSSNTADYIHSLPPMSGVVDYVGSGVEPASILYEIEVTYVPAGTLV